MWTSWKFTPVLCMSCIIILSLPLFLWRPIYVINSHNFNASVFSFSFRPAGDLVLVLGHVASLKESKEELAGMLGSKYTN